jgi:tetratricopeptide (TPR) repeat protein
VEFLLKAIQEFNKAVNLEPTPRGILNLAVAKASLYFCFRNHETDTTDVNIKEAISVLEKLINAYPSYAVAYFHLGLIHSRLGNYKDSLDIFTKALEVFGDQKSHVEPWCIYPAEADSNPKNNFILGKPLNTALLMYCRGDEDKAMDDIRNLYQAAIYYYVSILYEKNGQIYDSVEALIKSHNLCPDSGLVAMQAAKRMALLGIKEESISMYKKAIMLLPLDIDLRIEYIRMLYLYHVDRELPAEIKNVLQITKTMSKFKEKTATMNDVMNGFKRYHAASNYSHDSDKDKILNGWVEILFANLRKDPRNLKLVLRIIDIWYELGRVDKIFELIEDYINKHKGNGNIDNTMSSTLSKINSNLQKVCELRTEVFKEKVKRLKSFSVENERHVVNG